MKKGTLVRYDRMIGRVTNKKVTSYGCDVCSGSSLVEVYFSLYDETKKPWNEQQVWPNHRCMKLSPDLAKLAIDRPKKFLETLIEIENE
jgi:hypothetical protein